MKKIAKTDCDDTLVVYSGNADELTTAVNEILLDTEEGELREILITCIQRKLHVNVRK